jgi:hypothetical protein
LCGWGDLEAESSSATPQGIDAALTLLFFVMLQASFGPTMLRFGQSAEYISSLVKLMPISA